MRSTIVRLSSPPTWWTMVCGACASFVAVVAGGLVVSHGRYLALVAIAFVAVALARVSPAIPAGSIGLPTLVIALLGHDPFGAGTVRAGMLLWGLLALWFAARGTGAFARGTWLSIPVLGSAALAVLLAISTLHSSDAAYGWFKTEDFIAVNILALALALCVGQRQRDLHIFCWLTLGIAVAASIVLLHGLHSGTLNTSVGGRFSIADDEHPIELGRDAATGIIIALYLGMAARRRIARYAAVATIPLLGVALFAAGSRGPVLSFAVAAAVFAILAVRATSHRRRLVSIAAGFVAALAVVPRVVPQQDLSRAVQALAHGLGASSNGRTALWAEAWRIFSDHPLGGIGAGGFAAVEPVLRYPHNFLLELAAECGALGLVLGLLVVGAALGKGLRVWTTAQPIERLAASFICALLVAAVVNGCLSGDLPINGAIWTSVGLACAAGARFAARGSSAGAEVV